ncbi:hypothetical protein [Actinomyces sp. MRS3W]|uniref:hypothetical protein n=1 Tax=Actinomyces sp. MRS3W TaxID=2800796 RepID=UPI0028FD58D6|nr:hypothetical protein [Actinomyces sp. MRS3W]MDU0348281.1 hypothetical protein [Actinomyces sp. MRS3W]
MVANEGSPLTQSNPAAPSAPATAAMPAGWAGAAPRRQPDPEAVATAAHYLSQADAVLLGASNGLSIAEGLHLFAHNDAFEEVLGDIARPYGIGNILQACAFPWPTPEEYWGFWGRLTGHYMLGYTATPVMQDLRAIVGQRPAFVLTTNAEGHFELAGFADDQVYELEGSWRRMQCATGCHDTLYPSGDVLTALAAAEQNGRVPRELVPTCPRCGGSMAMQTVLNEPFIPDAAGREALGRFLAAHTGAQGRAANSRLAVLELGIGPRNQLIKAPLMELVAAEPSARYVTINLGQLFVPPQIASRSAAIDSGVTEALAAVRAAMNA